MKKTVVAALAVLITTMLAPALLVTLDKVKVQYTDEVGLATTVLEEGELVRVTNDNSIAIGDGVTTGGVARVRSGISVTNQWVDAASVTNVQAFASGSLVSWTTNGVAL